MPDESESFSDNCKAEGFLKRFAKNWKTRSFVTACQARVLKREDVGDATGTRLHIDFDRPNDTYCIFPSMDIYWMKSKDVKKMAYQFPTQYGNYKWGNEFYDGGVGEFCYYNISHRECQNRKPYNSVPRCEYKQNMDKNLEAFDIRPESTGAVGYDCYAYPCPTMIYLTWHYAGMMHRKYGGYYIIDPIQSYSQSKYQHGYPKYEGSPESQYGCPAYKHVTEWAYIKAHVKSSGSGFHFDSMDKMNWLFILTGSNNEHLSLTGSAMYNKKEIFNFPKNGCLGGCTVLSLESTWSPGEVNKVAKSGLDGYKDNQPPREKYQDHVCFPSELLQGEADERNWRKIDHNIAIVGGPISSASGRPAKTTIKMESKTNKVGVPQCGLLFKSSENWALDSPFRPWLVQVVISDTKLCLGTILTRKHILTAASCVKGSQAGYDIWKGNNYMTGENANGLTKQQIYVKLFKNIAGRPKPDVFLVSWIEVMPIYNPTSQDGNIAILGLLYPLQFSWYLYPICLPELDRDFDSRLFSPGKIMYSVKALQSYKTDIYTGPITNSLGPAIYEECKGQTAEIACKYRTLEEAYKNIKDTSYDPNTCLLIDKKQTGRREAKNIERKVGFLGKRREPGSIVSITIAPKREEEGTENVEEVVGKSATSPEAPEYALKEQIKQYECFENRIENQRQGVCITKRTNDVGFCDETTTMVVAEARLFEVQTTILPQTDCDGRNGMDISNSLRKMCTGYLPHRPSVYDVVDEDGKQTLKKYKGGYYRGFIPLIRERKRIVKFDQFGSITYAESERLYHKGFPKENMICHDSVEDMGAPTYFINSFNKDQMDESTEEPKPMFPHPMREAPGILKYAVLAGVQSEKRYCDNEDWYYVDEETIISGAGVMEFIKTAVERMDDDTLTLNDIFIDIEDQQVPEAEPQEEVTPEVVSVDIDFGEQTRTPALVEDIFEFESDMDWQQALNEYGLAFIADTPDEYDINEGYGSAMDIQAQESVILVCLLSILLRRDKLY